MDTSKLKNTDLRMINRLTELTPLLDPITVEREVVDDLEHPFSKITTFITSRPIQKELAFYYLYHHKVIDFVKLFSAEDIKDIYFHSHKEYDGFHDIGSPIYVILLGKELYNGQMINILNIFVDNFLRNPISKALIFVYQGTKKDFDFKYRNAQERGILNTGMIVETDKAAVSIKSTRGRKPGSKKESIKQKDDDYTTGVNAF